VTSSFAHLHTHTEYSMLDGAAKVKKLLGKAVELGQTAVASTDHGNVFSHYEMWKTAKEMREKDGADIRVVLGCELYVAPASRFDKFPVFWGSRGNTGSKGDSEMKDVSGAGAFTHMTMVATNAPGLNALFELTSRASIEGAYAKVGAAKPRIDAELLAEVLDNWPGAQLVGTTGCPSGAVQTRLRLGQWEKALEEAAVWRDILGEGNYFVELMDHGNDFEAASRPQLMELAKAMNLPLLATNDSHYVEPTQAKMHDALLCLQMGKKLSDTDRMKFDGSGYHLRSAEEMRKLFKELPDACDNTLEIADRVTADAYDAVLEYKDDLLPEFPVPEGHTPDTYLREQVMIGLKKKYPDPEGPEGITQEAWDRVPGYELPLIQRMGYSSYMLMVWDFIAWARKNGIRVGPGRGSAAGSGTSYALDITTVPTLEHGLLFERFINPERVSPPDVDVDFEKLRRDQVFRYLAEKWGEDKVCRIQTLGTIKAKAALKDAGRVLGMPYGLGEKLTKAFPKAISGFEAPLACVEDKEHPRWADAQDFRDLLEKEEGARAVFDLACELEGLIRSTGVHACGFVVASRPLMGRIPLVWSEKDQQMVSGFPNSDVLEPMGYLKVDCLGLDTMDVITLAVDMIRERHGIDVNDLLDDLDDPAAYHELASGHTVGMFQVASSGMSKLLSLMKADRFEDISAGLALYRPGPMAAEAHTDYALRKTGRQRIRPIHPDLEEALREVLGPTYGVICYQEQIMKAAQKVAGYSLGQADLLRKIMGKKKPEQLAKAKPPFFEGMAKEGYNEDAAQALWDVFEPFSAYAFNVAHTVSYGYITYATAYLKAHYPAEFMSALLTMAGDDKKKLALYLGETRRMGLKVLVPDVNEAGATFTPTDDGVRFGLEAVSGLGPKAVEGIISARQERPFRSFADFLDRIPETTCTKGAVKALIRGGGFDSLGYTRNALNACYEDGVGAYRGDKKKQSEGQFDLFSATPEVEFEAVTVPDLPEWDEEEKLAIERKALGTWVSGHPLTRLAGVLAGNRTITLAQLATDEPTEGTFQLSGQIVEVQHKVGKASGRGYAVVGLEDLTGSTEIRVLGRGYEEFRHLLAVDRRVTVKVYLKTEMKQRPGGEEYEETSVMVATIDDLDMSKVADEGDPREPKDLVMISLDAADVTEELVYELKGTLQEYPGNRPVWLKLMCEEGPVLYNLPGFNVDASLQLRGELKGMRGLTGVRF
jgi:DNA polymerase III subunit alpha